MSNANEIDMEYRPRSYWVYEDVAKRVGATVKGTVRRLKH